jgi:hypothetical protein
MPRNAAGGLFTLPSIIIVYALRFFRPDRRRQAEDIGEPVPAAFFAFFPKGGDRGLDDGLLRGVKPVEKSPEGLFVRIYGLDKIRIGAAFGFQQAQIVVHEALNFQQLLAPDFFRVKAFSIPVQHRLGADFDIPEGHAGRFSLKDRFGRFKRQRLGEQKIFPRQPEMPPHAKKIEKGGRQKNRLPAQVKPVRCHQPPGDLFRPVFFVFPNPSGLVHGIEPFYGSTKRRRQVRTKSAFTIPLKKIP